LIDKVGGAGYLLDEMTIIQGDVEKEKTVNKKSKRK
jgi:hypothetical protein